MKNEEDSDGGDSISELFEGVGNIKLVDQKVSDDISTLTTGTTRSRQRKLKRQCRQDKPRQHSLEHVRKRVTYLMSIFEEHGWFIPLPDNTNDGKVWSNRNYGADKKRQRKQNERQMIEERITQLEKVLKVQHGMDA